MLNTDFFTALAVLLLHIGAVLVLIVRIHQTRNYGMIGLILGLVYVGSAYLLFTHNAYIGQSNAYLRYYLRIGNGMIPLSIIIFVIGNILNDRTITKKIREGQS